MPQETSKSDDVASLFPFARLASGGVGGERPTARDLSDRLRRFSAPAGGQPVSTPNVRVRGRSFMALGVEPQPPLEAWFAALDQRIETSGGLFTGRPVIANLAGCVDPRSVELALAALDGLARRNVQVIGVEGINPARLGGTRWERLPLLTHGRDTARDDAAPPAARAAAPPAPSLLIDRPVRSGQSIVFQHGDVTVVGSVASGAEVVAGGSIHVYGALRGRAIAGVEAGGGTRIFCRKLEAELVAVDGLYRTAEHWGANLHGCAVQIQRGRGALKLTALA